MGREPEEYLDDIFALDDSECLHRNEGIARIIHGNGADHYTMWCFDCNSKRRKGEWIPKADLPDYGLKPEDIETVEDYRHEAGTCAVHGCHETGVEIHHWAPQSLRKWFSDPAHHWPTAYLCRDHHALWHRVVTPDVANGAMRVGEIMENPRKSTTLKELVDAARRYLDGGKGNAGV